MPRIAARAAMAETGRGRGAGAGAAAGMTASGRAAKSVPGPKTSERAGRMEAGAGISCACPSIVTA
ncbi:hypothetical protein AEGHOMDF_3431 [Methylobacterium soli]|nr:hypothetical protein AEGHOMDF_3431 [Methylobacterium soli]